MTELTEQLVKDYANYAKMDWDNQVSALIFIFQRTKLSVNNYSLIQMKNFRDIIEDTLIRLEEFQSIVAMVSWSKWDTNSPYRALSILNIFFP